MQLAELLGGKKDIVSEFQLAMSKQSAFFHKRFKAELVLKDGTRRFYRCKATRKDLALLEVLHFVDCLQKETGESIIWRFTDEKLFYLGSNIPNRPSKVSQMKKWLLKYFFDLEN
ncbi:hypothetical protein HPT25_26495 [Bacillus sp. BRMEA1]|uniref:DUF6018 family natural product bioysynthesis protein n=1 Tax=Neobacillus endophyticus TaxID=2738405 RepID=UPI0015677109|nr:DUF6018 family natural product bioysynthesis protein [Neobacillus endophyticus]NRD80882.1 hypothetical protein [Neobacillus endophyticus]